MFEAVQENPLPQSAEYPYYLNTGRGTVGQWHTQTRTREVAYVCDVSAALAQVHLHPDLARKYGIGENDLVEVASQNGTRSVFSARLRDTGDYGELYAPLHYIETNWLTPSCYDPYSFEPSYKYAPVSIRKYQEGL
jgi:assimilatory nitrate reductase catalytic subunit